MGKNLKDAEQALLNKIESRGMKRLVYHERFEDNPIKQGNTQIIARTRVEIVLASALEPGVELDEEDVLSRGMAECSYKDQFSRKKGRLIATARAWKNLEA